MTTEHVSVPRELIEALVKQWKQECMAFADMPAGIPVPKRLYLWNRVADLEDILSRATPSDEKLLPVVIYGKVYDVPIPVQLHIVSLTMQLEEAKQSAPRVVTAEEADLIRDNEFEYWWKNDQYCTAKDRVGARDRFVWNSAWAKALQSFATSLPAAVQDGEVRLWDTQWMTIVNHDDCYRDWSKDDAIAHAVKMTEQAIARNVADGKLPPKKIAAATQAGETK